MPTVPFSESLVAVQLWHCIRLLRLLVLQLSLSQLDLQSDHVLVPSVPDWQSPLLLAKGLYAKALKSFNKIFSGHIRVEAGYPWMAPVQSPTPKTVKYFMKLSWASSMIFFICNISYSLLTFVPPTSCKASSICPAWTYFWFNIVRIKICAWFLTFGTTKIIFLVFACIAFLWTCLFKPFTVALESKQKFQTNLNGIFALIKHF